MPDASTLTTILAHLQPGMVAMLATAAGATKYLVSAARRLWPALDGGYVQAVAGGIAVFVTLLLALAGGVFADGLTQNEAVGLLLVALVTWLGSVGWNEAEGKAAAAVSRAKDGA